MSKISMAAGGTAGIEEKISWLQKLLLYFLYVLAILMIVFSILAVGNLDEAGFQRCVENKCASRGQEFCQKPRELQNCCAGAGGDLSVAEGQYSCRFS